MIRLVFISLCLFFLGYNSKTDKKNRHLYFQQEGLPYGWKDITLMDSTFILDIKYASEDNFTGEKLYKCARCLLKTEVAQALIAVQKEVAKRELRIKIFDCYRPLHIQKRMWEIIPNPNYVAPPSEGSMHNRGLAIDLTLVNKCGKELNMGGPYDSFDDKSHHTYKELPETVLQNREYLRNIMFRYGFKEIQTEWWHYSYQSITSPISDFLWTCPASSKTDKGDH